MVVVPIQLVSSFANTNTAATNMHLFKCFCTHTYMETVRPTYINQSKVITINLNISFSIKNEKKLGGWVESRQYKARATSLTNLIKRQNTQTQASILYYRILLCNINIIKVCKYTCIFAYFEATNTSKFHLLRLWPPK